MLRKLLLLVAGAVQFASVAHAGDSVVFDNDRIRVTRYSFGARGSAKVSAQRSLLYCLSSSELNLKIGGQQELLSCDPDVALWNDGPFWLGHREGLASEFLVVEVKSGAGLQAQRAEDDGSRVSPISYGVMFDNEYLRVLRFRDNPGERLPAHSHPGNLLRYALTPLNARVIAEDGSVSATSIEAGAAQWFSAAERHSWENTGVASEYAIVIEVK